MQNRNQHTMADHHNQNGFTLLEVLLAITIFSIGLLAVAAMQVSAIHGNKLGNEWTQATTLAQEQMEALKSGDITTAAYTPGAYSDPNNPMTVTGASGGIFNRSWNIAANTDFSVRATVTVSWTQQGVSHSVVLTSITRGGGI
jgi:type IV pilus assembly protein PilV